MSSWLFFVGMVNVSVAFVGGFIILFYGFDVTLALITSANLIYGVWLLKKEEKEKK